MSGVSKLTVRLRVEARLEAATRQLKADQSQSNHSASFVSSALSPNDDAFLAQLDSYLQPPSAAGLAIERFDASGLLLNRGGGIGVAVVAAPALFEPVVLFEPSASSEELVRQLLTPPPAVLEPPPAAVAAVEAKGAKGKPAAAKDAKAAKPAKAP